MELVVARVGRAHGVRGDVRLDVRTDSPALRFTEGAQFATRPSAPGPLTLVRVRNTGDQWLVGFNEVTDRTAAEALRDVELVVKAEFSDEDDAWYAHELAGLRAVTPQGRELGTVQGLESLTAQDLLVVETAPGVRVLVPFVRQIVPIVDTDQRMVVIDPPGGLFSEEADNED